MSFNLNSKLIQMKSFVFLFLIMVVLACKDITSKLAIDDKYITEFEKNLSERANNRIKYLQLTGLYKLSKNTNTFGNDSINDFVLNIDNLPSQIGTISVRTDSLVFSVSENVLVKNSQDSLITNLNLKLDESGNSIKLFHNNINWQIITRSKQYYLRVWDTKNPAIKAFTGFEKFKLNSEFIFQGQFTYYTKAKTEEVHSKLGVKATTYFIGKITFEYNDETYDLDVGNNGFTMVSDKTSGNETYGGGRYIYLDLPEKDGLVTLDFNYLYNPPCAFSKFTTCLFPPRQNVLPFKILAGEKILISN